jgi:hypothetical protein
MDNAPYHSTQFEKLPTSCSTKAKMQEWLINHHVQFEVNYTKNQLWEVITPFRRNYLVQIYLLEIFLNENCATNMCFISIKDLDYCIVFR